MTQTYDRFAGQNLAIALSAVKAESLLPPTEYVDVAGGTAPVRNEGEWFVLQSAPGGTWKVEREALRQPYAAPAAPAVKQPLTAGGLIAIIVVLAMLAFIIIKMAF